MYKRIIFIIGFAIITGIGGWGINTYSKYTKPSSCLEATVNEIELMRTAWNTNLQSILEQEKPTSKMVDEAFESMRTYRCWLDYLCETVLFSGNADDKIMSGKTITEEHINSVSGCISPSKVIIPTTKLKFIPECKISKTTSTTATLEYASANLKTCKDMVALEFYADPNEKVSKLSESSKTMEDFKNRSSAYVSLEKALKDNSAFQKSKILTNKLADILTKMQSMEINMTYLNNYMNRLDSLMPCLADRCD